MDSIGFQMTLGLPNAKPLTRRAFYSAATGKGLKKKNYINFNGAEPKYM